MADLKLLDADGTDTYLKANSGDGSSGSPFVLRRASEGVAAHDAVHSGNPNSIGGKALSADPTAVASATP